MLIYQEIRKIPFLRLTIPFIIGIILQLYFFIDERSLLFSLIIFTTILLAYWYLTDKRPTYHQRWIFGIITSFALISLSAYITLINTKTNTDIVESEIFIGTINESPKETEKSVKLIVKSKSFLKDKIWKYNKSNLIIYLSKDSLSKKLKYGDKLIFKNSLKKIGNSDNPDEFDYKKYLARKQIYFQAFLKNGQWKLLNRNNGNIVFSLAYKTRNKLLEIYKENNISEDEFAILAALTLGVKDYLSDDIIKSYSVSGAMHILAVSGLHVGIIYIVLNNLLFFLRKKKFHRIIQSIIIIVFIWLFALITGLSPSVTRASTMLTFIIIGKASKRMPSTYNSLAISAFLMLTINPLAITYVGFQLSYFAVIAIVFFQPKIYRLLEFNNVIIDYLWQLTTVSIAAQIGTAFISIYYFHQFPAYFLLTNIIAIPSAFIIILLAISLLLFSFIPIISSFVALILTYIIKALNYSTSFIEAIPFSSISNISISNIEIILIYTAISFLVIFILSKKAKFLNVFFALIVLFFLFNNYRYYKHSTIKKFIVFNASGKSAIAFINNQNCKLITDSTFINKSKSLQYLTGNVVANNFIKSISIVNVDEIDTSKLTNYSNFNKLTKNKFFNNNNFKIAILNDSEFKGVYSDSKLKLDYIIIQKGFNMNIANLKDLFEFKKIIIDSSVPKWQVETILRDCIFEKIKVFYTKTDGAFIVDF